MSYYHLSRWKMKEIHRMCRVMPETVKRQMRKTFVSRKRVSQVEGKQTRKVEIEDSGQIELRGLKESSVL